MDGFRWWLFQRLFWLAWLACPPGCRGALALVMKHGSLATREALERARKEPT